MADTLEGQANTPPADNGQGQVDSPPAGGSPDVSQPPADSQGQVDQNVQEALRIANQRQAKIYQLESQLQDLQQRMSQPQTTDPEPDPANWQEWLKWDRRQTLKEAHQLWTQELAQYATAAREQQMENEFLQRHPDADLPTLKAFARMRGIANLEDAHTLYTLPQRTQSLTQQAVGQAFNQFQRPANQAAPVRGSQAASQAEMQGRFDKDYADFVRTNGTIYDSWPPERRLAFDREWKARESARTGRQ